MTRDSSGGGSREMGSYRNEFGVEENNDRFRGRAGAIEAPSAISFTTPRYQNSECFPFECETFNSEASYQ